jgi:hypothetical protein
LAPWEYRPGDDTKLDDIIRERLAWVDRSRRATIVNPCDVHFALAHLRYSFAELEPHLVFTKKDSELANSAARRLRSAKNALVQLAKRTDWLWPEDTPVAGVYHFTAAEALQRGMAALEEMRRQSIKFNDLILTIMQRPPLGSKNREEFVRGPLSVCYWRLFERDSGGRDDGPFARFGERFFEMIGNPIAPGTIARALKNRGRRHQPTARRRRAP